MISKGNLVVHLFLRQVEEDKGEEKAQEVTYQMDGIWDDGDRFCHLPSDYFHSDEERSNDDHYNQPSIIAGVILRRGRAVQLMDVPLRAVVLHLKCNYKLSFISHEFLVGWTSIQIKRVFATDCLIEMRMGMQTIRGWIFWLCLPSKTE